MSMGRTSTSFPSSTIPWRYDVFLSFRGDDTRKGFTDHLYNALELHGIITFKDDPQLQKGKALSPELCAAIEESRFAIIVLSENYAASTWCLDELLKILESMEARETVLPIFYHVDPADVRKQTGSFTQSFIKHEENLRNDRNKVRRWRHGLTKVANFSGWDSKDWYESNLIKNVVEMVWKKLRPTISVYVEDLVGIDSRLKPIDLFLDEKVNDGCFIGIWGMGGIGKTTIARVAYERISHNYDFPIFLADVRANVEQSGLQHLQKQLLSKIGMEKDDIWDIHEGVAMIRRFLRHKKVLLILDDVNHLSQLEYLAGNSEWFGMGSKVLITTRYERLLIKHGVETRFEVEELNDDEALQLFSWKAFKKDYPELGDVGLCNRVVDYAKGLPLAVKVLGSFLHGRDPTAWKSALDRLTEFCNLDIFEKLKISYDGLEYDEKRIFLDIACFFNKKHKDRVRETLDACGFYADIGIDALVEKSILTIDSHGTLSMHDLLQEMGRAIVRRESPDEPGRRSRLWRIEDIHHVLSKNTGSETIEAIAHPNDPGLVKAKQGVAYVNAKSFSKMSKLRYLKLNNVDLSNGLDYLPNSLRILEWPRFPLKSLPSSFNPEDLVELNLRQSCIEHLWKGIKTSYNLKIIDLSHSLSLVKTPDFRGAPYLEHLILEGCTKLYEVDASAGMLERLIFMNLKDCKNLVHLPSQVYGLKSLKVLNVSGCSKLEKFPSSVSGLKSLKVLNVSGCSKLDKLPEDLGHVESLEELDVSGTAITEASSIILLKNLQVLSFRGCKGRSSNPWNIMLFPSRSILLKIRPNPTGLRLPSLSGLHSLTSLDLSDCNLWEGGIPDDIGCLSLLKNLCSSRNPFASLPKSICQLSRLQFFKVVSCLRLQILPELPSSIFYVEAYNCHALETSGLDIVKPFTNRMRKEFAGDEFDFSAPGSEIPEWFNHISVGDLARIELHPGWFTDKWMGFAFCLVFAVPGCPGSYNYYIGCEVILKGNQTWPRAMWECGRNFQQATADQLWLFYVPCNHISAYNELQDIYTHLQVSFEAIDSKVEVKKFGVRIVY